MRVDKIAPLPRRRVTRRSAVGTLLLRSSPGMYSQDGWREITSERLNASRYYLQPSVDIQDFIIIAWPPSMIPVWWDSFRQWRQRGTVLNRNERLDTRLLLKYSTNILVCSSNNWIQSYNRKICYESHDVSHYFAFSYIS